MTISNSVVNVGQQDVGTQGNPAAPASVGAGTDRGGAAGSAPTSELPPFAPLTPPPLPGPASAPPLNLPSPSPDPSADVMGPGLTDDGFGESMDLGPPPPDLGAAPDVTGPPPIGPAWNPDLGRYA